MTSVINKLENKDMLLIGLFCLLAVERLLPVYEAFSKFTDTSFEQYKTILSKLYEILFSGDTSETEELSNQLDELIPDSDDYEEVIADQAQCAAICMMYTLMYLSDRDFSMAKYALQKLDEAVEIYGYEMGDGQGVAEREEAWQNELLDKFGSSTVPTKALVEQLREQNIGHAIPGV